MTNQGLRRFLRQIASCTHSFAFFLLIFTITSLKNIVSSASSSMMAASRLLALVLGIIIPT